MREVVEISFTSISPNSNPALDPSQCISQYKASCFKYNSVTREGRRENNYFNETLPDVFKQFSGTTTQKAKFFIKDFFNKCDQIRRKLKKFLMENFIFGAVME